MPPQPGEELSLTVFADVHYYVNAPGSSPQHDRFDRGSYVYLFYNPTQRRSRLEVANHAGTPEQDAFNGYLDTAILTHSRRQPNLVILTVNGIPGKPVSPQGNDQTLWTLPIYDQRREQKYMYKLHTIDVYFWTSEDAVRFVDASRRTLLPQQLRVDTPAQKQMERSEKTHSEHRDATHPVVQQLEQAAISDPYPKRPETASTMNSEHNGIAAETSAHSTSTTPATTLPVPAPYNPAAPVAPEPVAHREKTPPPLDAASGTGLAAAAVMDNPVTQYATQQAQTQYSQFTPRQAYFTTATPYSATSNSFPPPPPSSPPSNISQPLTPAFPGPPQPQRHSSVPAAQFTQYASGMQSPQFSRPTPIHSPSFPPPPPPGGPPSASLTGPPSSADFSNYTYTTTSGPMGSSISAQDAALHQQFYSPTEAEVAAQGHVGSHTGLTQALGYQTGAQVEQQQLEDTGHGKQQGKIGERVGRVEKGVNKWLRRLDQKI